jgi:hypothetical protein
MQRLLLAWFFSAGLLLLAGRAVAEEPSTKSSDADHAKATALVEKLGDETFEVREDAYAQLLKMGKGAVKALEAGSRHKDKEISKRCKDLLALATRTEADVALDALLMDKDSRLILKLPAYERFKKIYGDDQAARVLYIDIYTREGALLAGLERDPTQFEKAFRDRCREVQKDVIEALQKNQPNPVPVSEIEALLFAATDPRGSTDREAFVVFVHLLRLDPYREGFTKSLGARKVLTEFLKLRANGETMIHTMELAMEYDLKDLADTALKTATDKNIAPYMRGTCVLALGHLGTREQAKAIEALLSDKTAIGNQTYRDGTVTTELRDAALGALILLDGQDLQDYGFPFVKATRMKNQSCRSYNYLGFADDKQRDAALKKYKESQEKKAKDGEKK